MGPTRLELDKPVIAAIAGPAVAGGFELALWCDLRVMEASAYFGVYCRRWGVPLIDGGTVRLPRLVGAGRAMELILTGRKLPAEEAYRIGACEKVVPDGASRGAAEALACEIARFPQVCVRADRRSVRMQEGSNHVTRCAGSGTTVSWRLLRKALQERTASRRGGAGTESSKTSDSGLSRQPLRRANVQCVPLRDGENRTRIGDMMLSQRKDRP